MDGLLRLLPRAKAVGHAGAGDFDLAPDRRITRRGTAFIYAGAEIIDPRALDGFEGKFSLNPVWDRMLAAGRLHGGVHAGAWVDVGRPEGIALAEAALAG
jgi:MurNAc alpha-1-phosphate uridylyltransferase